MISISIFILECNYYDNTMAPLPKRRHSTRRGGKRKASIVLEIPSLSGGKQNEPYHQPHRAHVEDGYYVYRGKKVAKV